MRILQLLVIGIVFLPAPARTEPATGAIILMQALQYWMQNCWGKSEAEWNELECGPGGRFHLAPEVRKQWHRDYVWRKHCGDIAANYCRRKGLPDDCSLGPQTLHSKTDFGDDHTECYLRNWRGRTFLGQHCGDIAEKYCEGAGQPVTCQYGVTKLHSGDHPECDG